MMTHRTRNRFCALPFCAVFFCAALLSLPVSAQKNAWDALNPPASPAPVKGEVINPSRHLIAFSSEKALSDWISLRQKEFKVYAETRPERRQFKTKDMEQGALMESQPSAAAADMKTGSEPAPESVTESVTNTQTAGVDEGGIVKVHGDFLVILRRGRLFTIDVHGQELKPVSTIDAFAPDSAGGGWYDELLISGNTVVVIGYSYSKGGTEVILFRINNKGQLSYQSTSILRSNDYYSSRNYASRLIGNTLIFYTPLYLNFYGRQPLDDFPAIRHWHSADHVSDFKRIAPATRIFRVNDDFDPDSPVALHTVQQCDLSKAEMTCEATAVIGPAGREFYVSKDAVFVWTTPMYFRRLPRSATGGIVTSSVFRIPLNGKDNPTALKTLGSPIDQFSFLESSDGYLNVLLKSEGLRASMWASEAGSQNLALLRVPVSRFGNGTEAAPSSEYYPLPSVGESSLQNRFIGDYLIYGSGDTWNRGKNDPAKKRASGMAVHWKSPQTPPAALPAEHTIDRIEALGSNPLLVGTHQDDLYFSTFSLDLADGAVRATRASVFKFKDAAQGETRSHGFFYKQDAENKENGLLGLPFVGANESGWRQLKKPAAGVIFLKNEKLQLSELGTLNAAAPTSQDDHCKASCVDWYGNSRPIFLKGRIFALMGYELVEGALNPDPKRHSATLSEIRRIHFMPGKPSQRPRAK